GRGQLDVAGDERDRIAQLLRTEGRVKRGDELASRLPARGQLPACGRIGRRPPGPDRQGHHHALQHVRVRGSKFRQPGVELIAAPTPGVEEIRGAVENRGGGLLDPQRRTAAAGAVEPRLNDNAVQPAQLVYQAYGRPGRSAQPGRTVGRREEGAAQRL